MHMRRTITALLAALVVLTGCGQQTAGFGEVANQPQEHAADGEHAAQPTPAGGGLQPVLATSELVVGPNRMAFGLLQNNVPIRDAAQT